MLASCRRDVEIAARGGPPERARIAAAGLAIELAPPLPAVRDLLRDASLVVANDCGPAHFAYIHDVPRVALFDRSVDSSHWFWPGRNGRLLESPAPGTIDRIAAADVLELADELLGD